MRKFILTVLVFGALAAASVFAGESAGQRRFTTHLNALDSTLKHAGDGQAAAEALVSSGQARIAAFSLQALAKVYEGGADGSAAKDFKSIRKMAKGIEDGIGEVDKWQGALEKAVKDGASQAKVKQLRSNVEQSLAMFASELEDEGFLDRDNGPIAKAFKQLAKMDWGSAVDDQDRVLKSVRKQLKKVAETSYDLGRLEKDGPGEDGNGFHELRREIRWFALEARALEGAVSFRSDTRDCPVQAYRKNVEDPALLKKFSENKYASLPVPAVGAETCGVSRCLFYQVAQTIGDLGDIKDAAERQNLVADPSGHTDLVPRDLQVQAERIAADVKANALLETLADQIQACRK
jgi:hypothetical protein